MTRILSTNDDNLIPGTIVCVEVSTHESSDKLHPGRKNHTFRGWHAISGRMEGGKWTREKQQSSSDAKDFWSYCNYVRRTDRPLWIFFCGLHRSVTLLGFWSLMEAGEFTLSLGPHPSAQNCTVPRARAAMMRTKRGILLSNSPPSAIIGWHRSRWQITLVDLQNYLDWPMRELARLVNLPFSQYPKCCEPDGIYATVCRDRCRVVQTCVERFVVWHNRQELGRFGLTISGVALASFRHRFMRDRIELPESQDERDWERSGYFNGRTEALWVGKTVGSTYTPVRHWGEEKELFTPSPRGPFYLIDARSFYGAIAQFCELPVACVESHIDGGYHAPPLDESIRECMAGVLIESKSNAYPCHYKGRCLYATGRIVTTLCGDELAAAVKAADVKKIFGWRRYRLGQPLRWYSQALWQQRVESEAAGDGLTASICKSMLARLHGKFLQRATRWTILPGVIADIPWSRWTETSLSSGRTHNFRAIGNDVQIEDDAGDSKHCFPALAAWVTSHGRVWLNGWQKMAGVNNVLYVSTDSLIVTQAGLDALVARGIVGDHGIGSLKIDMVSDRLVVRGPNNYELGDRTVLSGRPLRGLKMNGDEWTAEEWQSLEETFLAADKSSVASRQKRGTINATTALGEIGPGGWLTSPIVTMEIEECHPQIPPQSLPSAPKTQSREWKVKDTSIFGMKLP